MSPISEADWGYDRAAHLYERAGFGATPAEIEELASMTPTQAVSRLVEYSTIDASNLASFDELRLSLASYGRSLSDLPVVVQYNKRDLARSFDIEALHRKLDLKDAAVFEAVAREDPESTDFERDHDRRLAGALLMLDAELAANGHGSLGCNSQD